MSATEPTTVLHNTKTDRYHPLVYRPAARPSDGDEDIVRHRSRGHHTEGFNSLEAAVEWINGNDNLKYHAVLEKWNGIESPHGTMEFSLSEHQE